MENPWPINGGFVRWENHRTFDGPGHGFLLDCPRQTPGGCTEGPTGIQALGGSPMGKTPGDSYGKDIGFGWRRFEDFFAPPQKMDLICFVYDLIDQIAGIVKYPMNRRHEICQAERFWDFPMASRTWMQLSIVLGCPTKTSPGVYEGGSPRRLETAVVRQWEIPKISQDCWLKEGKIVKFLACQFSEDSPRRSPFIGAWRRMRMINVGMQASTPCVTHSTSLGICQILPIVAERPIILSISFYNIL